MVIGYKQTFYDSCLTSCLLMLTGEKKFDMKKLEKELFTEGERRTKGFYVMDIIRSVQKKLPVKVTVTVDNAYFTKVLKSKSSSKRKMTFKHSKVTVRLLDELLSSGPVICYIDNRILTRSSHLPHFIVIEKKRNGRYYGIDPWKGGRIYLREEKLQGGINSLRDYLKICPLMIVIS